MSNVIKSHENLGYRDIESFDQVQYKTLYCRLNKITDWAFNFRNRQGGIKIKKFKDYSLINILRAWKACAEFNGFVHPILDVPENETAIRLYIKLNSGRYKNVTSWNG